MKVKEKDSRQIFDELLTRYPQLNSCSDSILDAYQCILDCYRTGGKLLLAGNGGSAADCDHISGELNKSFRFKRKIDSNLSQNLRRMYGEKGDELRNNLEGALPAIPLTVFASSNTAYANDVSAECIFAQLVNSIGTEKDVLIAISTSGNSKNLLSAIMVANAKGIRCIGLTGKTGGAFNDLCEITIRAPEDETFKVQELHLPIYHALCSMVEADLF